MFGITDKYVSEDKLKLTILKRDFGSTSVVIGFNKGAFHQPKDKPGLAHFAEHMIMKESENYPDLEETNRQLLIRGVYQNAFTSAFNTRVVLNVPDPADLEYALKVAFDRINNPLFLKDRLEKEKNAIYSELRSDKQDNSLFATKLSFNSLAGINETNWGIVPGSEEVIKNISKLDIEEFMKKTFTLDNLRVGIAGNIDVDIVKKLLEKYKCVDSREVNRNAHLPIKPIHIKYNPANVSLNILQEMVPISLPTLKEQAMLILLVNYLSGSQSSLLAKVLRYDQGLVYSTGAWTSYSDKLDFLRIEYEVLPELYSKFIESKDKIYSELSQGVINVEIFEAVKSYRIKVMNKWFESSDSLLSSYMLTSIVDKPFSMLDIVEELQSIQISEFKAFTAKVFSQKPIASVEVK